MKSSAPDKQSFRGNGSGWYMSDELTLPDFDIVDAPVQAPKPKEATGVSWYEEHYKSLAPQYNSLLARYNSLVKKYNALVTGNVIKLRNRGSLASEKISLPKVLLEVRCLLKIFLSNTKAGAQEHL